MLCMSLIVMVCLASCSDTPKYARVISKDAPLVVRVDVKQIAEKAQTADSKQLADKLTEEQADMIMRECSELGMTAVRRKIDG